VVPFVEGSAAVLTGADDTPLHRCRSGRLGRR
jgi:hypothetical protein